MQACPAVSASRFLAGEPDAVATVVGWIRLALAPFRFRLGAECEDLAQHAQLELLRALGAVADGPTELRAYVWRVTTRSAIDRLRSRRRWRFEEFDEFAMPPAREPSALDSILRDERRAELVRLLLDLPRVCRDLFEQLYEGLSYAEMALQHGVSESTLRVRVLRCRRRALALVAGNAAAPRAPELLEASTEGVP